MLQVELLLVLLITSVTLHTEMKHFHQVTAYSYYTNDAHHKNIRTNKRSMPRIWTEGIPNTKQESHILTATFCFHSLARHKNHISVCNIRFKREYNKLDINVINSQVQWQLYISSTNYTGCRKRSACGLIKVCFNFSLDSVRNSVSE
jgi:hypothetical protein